MSQRWALRPVQDPEWTCAADLAAAEVEAVLRAVVQRGSDHDAMRDEAVDSVDPWRIYLC
jgi:hypothetical protein